MDSTPDTSCTITLLNLDAALRNGIHIDRTKTVDLYHAARGSVHVEGMANIHVCTNDVQAMLQVAVSSELKETMLISWEDLRKLRVIPADFPNAVLSVKTNEQLAVLKRKLLKTFDRTLSDELNPSPMKCAPNVHHTTDGRHPYSSTSA